MKKIYFIILLIMTSCKFVTAQCDVYGYIANRLDNTVSILNTTDNTVAATAQVGSEPVGLTVNPAGTTVYVVNAGDNTISVLDAATASVTTTIPVGNSPIGAAISYDGATLYVTNQADNTVSVINTATNAVQATITVGTTPIGIIVNRAGNRVYVANQGSNSVSVIDAQTNTVLTTLVVGSSPFGLGLGQYSDQLYVTNTVSNNVTVINISFNFVVATIPVGSSPMGVFATSDGNYVYVANKGSNTVSVINPFANAVSYDIAVGAAPVGVGVNPLGNIFVANQDDNTVSVIDGNSSSVTATIPVGAFPFTFGNLVAGTCGPELVLPLTFLSFNAQLKNSQVALFWQTADEVNTNQFLVQRSLDGVGFSVVGQLPAQGSTGTNTYSYTDQLPEGLGSNATVYYRLRQVDKDGKLTYSTITSVALSDDNKPLVSLYPNPAVTNTVYIKGENLKIIEVMDHAGRKCLTQNAVNSLVTQINVASLPAGMYLVRITDTNENKTMKKLVIK